MRGVGRDGVEALAYGRLAGHLGDAQAHVGHFQHVAPAQRIPGVHAAVLAQGDVHASGSIQECPATGRAT